MAGPGPKFGTNGKGTQVGPKRYQAIWVRLRARRALNKVESDRKRIIVSLKINLKQHPEINAVSFDQDLCCIRL